MFLSRMHGIPSNTENKSYSSHRLLTLGESDGGSEILDLII